LPTHTSPLARVSSTTNPSECAPVPVTSNRRGRARAVRLTVPRIVGHVQKLRGTLGTAAALRKVEHLREAAEPREREKAAEEIEQLREVLGKVARSLRAKG
jgi:hypothetical protein